MLVSSDLTRDGSGFGPGFFLSAIRAPDMLDPSSGRMIDQRPSTLWIISLSANRQIIVELFPTAHRRGSCFLNRHVIVEIRSGGKWCSQLLGARLLPPIRCLRSRISANDCMGNLMNCRRKQALRCLIIGSRCHSLAPQPHRKTSRSRPKSVSRVSALADIPGGDEVAEETHSGLYDELSVRTYPREPSNGRLYVSAKIPAKN
jgi:hypothetical protein